MKTGGTKVRIIDNKCLKKLSKKLKTTKKDQSYQKNLKRKKQRVKLQQQSQN